MDEQLLRQLTRQLKIMNIWISIFGTLILAVLIVLGYFVFKIVTFVNTTNQKIENLTTQTKETLDFKSKVCSTDSVGSFLQDKTNVCKQ
jgi:hypothetical protein